MLQRLCSPEQIAGRLRLEDVVMVSCWWIYRWIAKDRAAGGLLYLPLRRRGRKPKARPPAGEAGEACLPGPVDISERPPEAEGQGRAGD